VERERERDGGERERGTVEKEREGRWRRERAGGEIGKVEKGQVVEKGHVVGKGQVERWGRKREER